MSTLLVYYFREGLQLGYLLSVSSMVCEIVLCHVIKDVNVLTCLNLQFINVTFKKLFENIDIKDRSLKTYTLFKNFGNYQ